MVGNYLTQAGIDYIEQVRMGKFWVDFLLPDRRIALESDGTYWHGSQKVKERDARKTAFLEHQGWCVMRITDLELENAAFPLELLCERVNIPLLAPVKADIDYP